MMRERPILFSGPMVRAIQRGDKTQTRRIVAPRQGLDFIGGAGQENDSAAWGYAFDGPDHSGYMVLARGLDERHDHGSISMPCPYGEPGDRLWVRETWAWTGEEAVVYRADTEVVSRVEELLDHRLVWTPSIFMPRWASRITLEITDVRVQRLQDIGPADIRAEGIESAEHRAFCAMDCDSLRAAWIALWDGINGKRAPWSVNPWVWAVTFVRVDEIARVA